eukprot:771780-Karenia_brevis.AAC.1
MDQLPDLEDPQTALRLLRSCGGCCKLVHSMRTVPPSSQARPLALFDTWQREAFCSITGLLPSHQQWEQASRSFQQGGLGLRQCAKHAPAAYLASQAACLELCTKLDNAYSLSMDTPGSDSSLALQLLNAQLPPDRHFTARVLEKAKQKDLSEALDKAAHAEHLAAACA